MGFLKTLLGGTSKIWAGTNNGSAKELSLSGHKHSEYALTSHTHGTSDITSGILSVARGGTGYSSLSSLASALSPYLSTGNIIVGSGNSSSIISVSFTSGSHHGIIGILHGFMSAGTAGTSTLTTGFFYSYYGSTECNIVSYNSRYDGSTYSLKIAVSWTSTSFRTSYAVFHSGTGSFAYVII